MSENVATLPAARQERMPTMNLFEDFDKAMRIAEALANSDMVPADYRGKPQNCLVAMQMGSELGLQPMQSIQNISVINGRPAVWGDLALALVQAHPECEDVQETLEREDTPQMTAVCLIKRRGRKAVVRTFSVDDAIKARLWDTREKVTRYKKGGGGTYQADNDSPWFRFPKRMLQMRARGFALRDCFPDALKGIGIVEEVRDYPAERQVEGEHDFKGPPEQEKPQQQTDRPKDRDSALASKLKGEAPAPAHEPAAADDQDQGPRDDPQVPEQQPEDPDEPSGSELDKVAASIEQAIAYIEVPADANEIMDTIKAAPLTSAQKADLRKKVHARVKEVGRPAEE